MVSQLLLFRGANWLDRDEVELRCNYVNTHTQYSGDLYHQV
jgi:hypothetical protein